jgi:hypothetical protein
MHNPSHLCRPACFTEACPTHLLQKRSHFRTQRITGEEDEEAPPTSVALGASIGMSIALLSAVNNLFTADALPQHWAR